MSQRFRITVRALGVELRGYIDNGLDEEETKLSDFAKAMEPIGVVVASPVEHDYNPFKEWTASDQERYARITRLAADVQQQLANIKDVYEAQIDDKEHPLRRRIVMQRREIRQAWLSSRNYQAMWRRAKSELEQRELHHFETEQENERLKADHSDTEKQLIDQVNNQADTIERMSALLERIKQARSNHPDLPVCEKYKDEEDAVTCGWRLAVHDIDKVLADVP